MAPEDATRSGDGKIVAQSTGWNLWLGAMWALAGVLCVSFAAKDAGGVVGRVVFVVAAVGCAGMLVRAFRAGAYVQPDGVVVRGFFRSRRLSWEEIEDVAPSMRGASYCLWFRLRGGTLVPVRGCGSYSGAKLEQMAAAIRAARPSGEVSARRDPATGH